MTINRQKLDTLPHAYLYLLMQFQPLVGLLQLAFSNQMIGAYLIGCDHFVHVVILQQLPKVLFGDGIFGGLKQHEIEDESLLDLQFGHVVIYLTDDLVYLGVLDHLLAADLFLGEDLVPHPG